MNTNSAGQATFSYRTDQANAVAASEYVSMTATDPQTGNTSEFSEARVVPRPPAVAGFVAAFARPAADAVPLGPPTDGDGNPNAWVTALPDVGTLRLDGVPVVLNQVIPAADLDRLVYAAPAGTAEPASEFAYRLGTPGGFGDTDFAEAGTDLQGVITEFSVPPAAPVGAEVFLDAGDDDLDATATFVWTVTLRTVRCSGWAAE